MHAGPRRWEGWEADPPARSYRTFTQEGRWDLGQTEKPSNRLKTRVLLFFFFLEMLFIIIEWSDF